MEDCVPVGVSFQRGNPREKDASQPERPAGSKPVSIETKTDPRHSNAPAQQGAGDLKIDRTGHFQVPRTPRNDPNRMAGGAHHRRLVRSGFALCRRPEERVPEQAPPETLWRLDSDSVLPIHEAIRSSAGAHAPQSVRRTASGDRGAMAVRGLDDLFDQRRRWRRPRPVVDGHQIRKPTLFPLEPFVERVESARCRFLAGATPGTEGDPVALLIEERTQFRLPGIETQRREDEHQTCHGFRSEDRAD